MKSTANKGTSTYNFFACGFTLGQKKASILKNAHTCHKMRNDDSLKSFLDLALKLTFGRT